MLESDVIERVEEVDYWPLPRPLNAAGEPRRTGIEIEFTGLSEVGAARIVQRLWGGGIKAREPHLRDITGTRIGTVKVLLDSALAKPDGSALAKAAFDLTRAVIPVEVVLPPLPPALLPEADCLATALREAGAAGSREALTYGFGVHLNVEVAALSAEAIVPVLRAYALLEDWLRAADPIAPARRVLPFVDPYPRAFVDLLAAEGADWSLADITRAYLTHTPTRNRGLDLLPLLEEIAPEAVRAVLGAAAKGPRPAWHFRLPEARVNEADWSIAYEWNRWCIVERVAADADLLESLAADWQVYRAAFTTVRGDWEVAVEERLRHARIWEAQAP